MKRRGAWGGTNTGPGGYRRAKGPRRPGDTCDSCGEAHPGLRHDGRYLVRDMAALSAAQQAGKA